MKPLLRDMERLGAKVRLLAELVEEATRTAVQALCERRPDLAQRVIEAEVATDLEEVRIEEECVSLLARHEPVASDLRRAVAVLKVDSELERMADLARHIAERALALAEEPVAVPIPDMMRTMTESALGMVRDALDAFARSDVGLALAVRDRDDEVDRLHREILGDLKQMIRSDPGRVDAAFHLFSASQHLERIADHATNIAENVVYLRQGDIIRHRPMNPGT